MQRWRKWKWCVFIWILNFLRKKIWRWKILEGRKLLIISVILLIPKKKNIFRLTKLFAFALSFASQRKIIWWFCYLTGIMSRDFSLDLQIMMPVILFFKSFVYLLDPKIISIVIDLFLLNGYFNSILRNCTFWSS